MYLCDYHVYEHFDCSESKTNKPSKNMTQKKKGGKGRNLEPSQKWKNIGFGDDLLEKE